MDPFFGNCCSLIQNLHIGTSKTNGTPQQIRRWIKKKVQKFQVRLGTSVLSSLHESTITL